MAGSLGDQDPSGVQRADDVEDAPDLVHMTRCKRDRGGNEVWLDERLTGAKFPFYLAGKQIKCPFDVLPSVISPYECYARHERRH